MFTPKPTPVASTSSDNLPQEVENDINSTSYNGFIQQFENDDDDVEENDEDEEGGGERARRRRGPARNPRA